MQCSTCKFYVKSTLYGNYCKCNDRPKPCALVRKQKYNKKRKYKYAKYNNNRK